MSDTEKMIRSTAHNVLRMEKNPLEVMIKPRSVDVVGATEASHLGHQRQVGKAGVAQQTGLFLAQDQ